MHDEFRMFEARNSGLQGFSIHGLYKNINAIASTRSGWRFRGGCRLTINGPALLGMLLLASSL